jgi:[ribosomal protein S5]-alanine N-acetyltransferase
MAAIKPEPIHPPTLETQRLRLRPLLDTDADAVFAIFSSEDAMRYWSTGPWTDRAEAARLIERDREALRAADSIRFGLVERETGRMIGCCSIHHIDHGNRRAEVGYILLPSHWGRGLMHEAMSALVAYAFDDLTLHRLEADLDPRNAPSARSIERLGFAREGTMRGRWLVNGEVCDSWFYGLLKDDWDARRDDAAADVVSTTNRSCPAGTIIPTLIYDDVPRAIAWLRDVFGFEARVRAGQGHAQLCCGSGGVMLGQSRVERDASDGSTREFGPPDPQHISLSLMVKVDDLVAHHAHASAAGARIVQQPTDHVFGERQYTALDLEGHRWTFSQSIADVDPTSWGAEWIR